MIAGLEILNLHAQGGMAEVYRARGKGADGNTWQYAVKRILPELTSDPDLRQMFVEEARIASLLVHPNIVRVYDLAKSENDELYIVMEFLEGRDLAEAVDRVVDMGKTIPVWLAIHVAREVLKSLIYATTLAADREGRALALIHRDISPHNIFMCFDGQVKLTDFGVAKVAQSSVHTQIGVTKGKFGYMSPEQLMSEKLDFRSDLYNVGILLYEALTCRRLFFGDNPSQFLQAMLKNEVPPLDPALRVPPDLDALMRRALAKNRLERPQSAAAFDAELKAVAERYHLTATRDHVAGELRVVFGSEIESCAVGAPPENVPLRLASLSAAHPDILARAEVPAAKTPAQLVGKHLSAPQIVPSQQRGRGLSDPSIDVKQVLPAPTRKKTGSIARGTNAVRPLDSDDDPATMPPDDLGADPSTLPPGTSDTGPAVKRPRSTVVTGGQHAKPLERSDEDPQDVGAMWADSTERVDRPQLSGRPVVKRGGVVTSRRVVPIAPKKR